MKLNKIFFLIFPFISATVFAQYINESKIKSYKKEVVDFLIKKNKFSSRDSLDDISNMLYITELYNAPNNISIYEVSTTSPHSLKYFSIVKEGKIYLFNSVDLNEDFSSIINKLENSKLSANKIFKIFNEISATYQYNRKINNNEIKVIKPDVSDSDIR